MNACIVRSKSRSVSIVIMSAVGGEWYAFAIEAKSEQPRLYDIKCWGGGSMKEARDVLKDAAEFYKAALGPNTTVEAGRSNVLDVVRAWLGVG